MRSKRLKTIWMLIAAAALMVPAIADARHAHRERWYQENWCRQNRGETEVVLPDQTRCDCLTESHAIEFDFAPKWAEAIGQALYYGLQTGKQPGVVLILENDKDYKYWVRLNSTIERFGLPIRTWKMTN